MIRMLHFVQDEKFTTMTISYFDNRTDIVSKYVYFRRDKRRPLVYIQNNERISIIDNYKEIISEFQSRDYDVLYLHSIYITFWPLLRYVPQNKIIIWWMWGYEIYLPNSYGQRHGFVNMETILPVTKSVRKQITSKKDRIKQSVKGLLVDMVWPYYKKKIVGRIDYFYPVIHSEYEIMKQVKGFHAKEFYLPHLRWPNLDTEIVVEGEGDIQIGNSASQWGNHLDVWEHIKKYVPVNSRIVLPLSYGDKKYATYIQNAIKREHENIEIMNDFLPFEEYFNVIKRCSFFVHGAIRQHAMGNIYDAIMSGRKVFLYKDSLDYKHLHERGYVVFTIEDIDDSSFRIPLTLAEFRQNLNARLCEMKHRTEIGNRIFREIEEIVQ